MKKSLGAKTIASPVPAWAIGTYSGDGKPNVMTAAWGSICCSRPPCMAVALRQATSTYGNMVARQAFTISIPSQEQVREIDYIGLVSGRDRDKFADLGLTPGRAEHVDAPYIQEFPVIIECKLLHKIELGLHTQFIGETMDIKADESILDGKGHVDASKLRPVVFTPGIRTYHGLGDYLGRAFSIGREILPDEE
ncbi:MAG: flavin reductase family protein [Thermoleophilia bacterium]|nr:flavin reductase family protein [Thermoleophilia bacterium]